MRGRDAVGVGDEHLEGRPFRIARIQRAVLVGVEHVGERLHVARGRGIPERELVGFRPVDVSRAILIEHQHAVAGGGPGHAMLGAIAVHVAIDGGGLALGDADAVAIKVEHDGEREAEADREAVAVHVHAPAAQVGAGVVGFGLHIGGVGGDYADA